MRPLFEWSAPLTPKCRLDVPTGIIAFILVRFEATATTFSKTLIWINGVGHAEPTIGLFSDRPARDEISKLTRRHRITAVCANAPASGDDARKNANVRASRGRSCKCPWRDIFFGSALRCSQCC